jgi:ubiquinone/menaquinone biosynthesis C-methylase UbiE
MKRKEIALMSFFETEETHQFTFEAFAAHPFYTAINRLLVQQALAALVTRPPDATLTIVDMACGTGAITRLIAEELTRRGRQARLIAVDPSADALRRAQKSIEEMGAKADFFQGEAVDLPTLVHDADAAFFCNAIHLIADKRATFRQMAAILALGGIFACNSAFYEGTNVESTLRFSRLWIRRAVQWLRKAHPEVQLSREAKAIAMQWFTPEEYRSLLRESGFSRVEIIQAQVMMSLEGLRDLGHYWLFIQGALPGAPLALGAAALGTTVYQTAQELGMTEVPRMWLQIIARNGS